MEDGWMVRQTDTLTPHTYKISHSGNKSVWGPPWRNFSKARSVEAPGIFSRHTEENE